tara:strand:+ start:304 stop:726 length:423 start_codon:yes stop_codon:yes gene_type:complete
MSIIIDMLRKHEGVETHAYKCTADKITIGVGRNIDKGGGIGLSDDEIDYLLSNDIKRVSSELIRAFPWYSELDEVRKDALTDLCFNVGLSRLMGFKKALAAMATEDYEIAADEFLDSRWAKQVGSRAFTITEMIRTGDYL